MCLIYTVYKPGSGPIARNGFIAHCMLFMVLLRDTEEPGTLDSFITM